MMEAIRLSLASEEERRKKEEKDAKRRRKEEAKRAKKAEKSSRKNSLFTLHSNTSNNDSSEGNILRRERSSTIDSIEEESRRLGKGKGVDRTTSEEISAPANDDMPQERIPGSQPTSLLSTSQESLSGSFPPTVEPFRRSHLRQMSNVSSSASSFVEGSGQAFAGSSTPPGGGAGMDSMFNFRSLAAAMIGDEEKGEDTTHVENSGSPGRPGSFEEIGEPSPAESSEKRGSIGQKHDTVASTTKEVNGSAEKASETVSL